jgi:acetoin utilization protein AcuB
MNAEELMTVEVLTCSPEESIGRLIQRFESSKVSGMPVVNDEDELVGIISESDILDAESDDEVKDYMSTPVLSVDKGAPVEEIATIFKSKHVNRLPVVSKGKLEGIVTRDDLISYLANILAWRECL